MFKHSNKTTQATSQLQQCDLMAQIGTLHQRIARHQDTHPAQLGPLFEMYEQDASKAAAATQVIKTIAFDGSLTVVALKSFGFP